MKDASKPLFSVTKKDLDFSYFRCPGHGGQNVNKVSSGVRIVHRASGAVSESCKTRDQYRNKRDAFLKLAHSNKFQAWMKMETARVLGKPSIEEIVDNLMREANIKTEVRGEDGRWELWN